MKRENFNTDKNTINRDTSDLPKYYPYQDICLEVPLTCRFTTNVKKFKLK